MDAMEKFRQAQKYAQEFESDYDAEENKSRMDTYGLEPDRSDNDLSMGDGESGQAQSLDGRKYNQSRYKELTEAPEINSSFFPGPQFAKDVLQNTGKAMLGMREFEGVVDEPAAALKSGMWMRLMDNPQEMEAKLGELHPNARFHDSKDGSRLVDLDSGTYVLNKPGLSKQDALNFTTRAATEIATAGKGRLAIQAGKAALTETAIQGAQKAGGGEFDAEMPFVSAAGTLVFGKAVEMASPYVNMLGKTVMERVDDFDWLAEKLGRRGDPQAERTAKIVEGIKSRDSHTIAALGENDPQMVDAWETIGAPSSIPAEMLMARDDMAAVVRGLTRVDKTADNFDNQMMLDTYESTREKIMELGNISSISGVNDAYIKSVDDKIGKIKAVEKKAWDRLESHIPKNLVVKAFHAEKMINAELKKYKGDGASAAFLRKMLREVKTTVKIRKMTDGTEKITFENGKTAYDLKDSRTRIGDALKKDYAVNEFSGVDRRLKSMVYEALGRDQDDIFNSLFAGGRSTLTNMQQLVEAGYKPMPEDLKFTLMASRRLTAARKTIQDRKTKLVGQNVETQLYNVIDTALRQGMKHDAGAIRDAIKNVEPEHRQTAMLTGMAGMFDKPPEMFAKNWEKLSKATEVRKEIEKYAPKDVVKMFDSTAAIFSRWERLKKQGLKSDQLDKMFNDRSWIANKVYSSVYVPVKLLSSVFNTDKTLLSMSFRDFFDSGTDNVKNANEFISSTNFRDLMYTMQKDVTKTGEKLKPKMKLKEKAIMQSKEFKKWLETMPPEIRQTVAQKGFVAYLMTSDMVGASNGERMDSGVRTTDKTGP